MRRFLRQLFLAFGLFVAFASVIGGVLYYINDSIVDHYRFRPGVTTIFIGDSHVKMAVDDAQLPGTVNLAEVAEPTIYSFYKAKALIRHNAGIRRIYLGFSYHNVSSFHDRYISGRFSKGFAAKYFYTLPPAQKAAVYQSHWQDAGPLTVALLRESVGNAMVRKGDYPFIGGFENKFTKDTSFYKMEERVADLFPANDSQCRYCTSNIHYLQLMAQWCRQSGIELVILNLPIHPYVLSRVPACIKDQYQRIIRSNHLRTLSFQDLVLEANCFAPDGDHLSMKGAQKITAYLRQHGY